MAEWSKSQSPYPVQVTRWLKDQSECDSVVDGLLKQHVSCAIFTRDIGNGIHFSVFRERLEGDPEDLEDQRYFPCSLWRSFTAPDPEDPGASSLQKMREIDIQISDAMRLVRTALKYREWSEVSRYALAIEKLSDEKTQLAEQYKRECVAEAEQIERERKEVAA